MSRHVEADSSTLIRKRKDLIILIENQSHAQSPQASWLADGRQLGIWDNRKKYIVLLAIRVTTVKGRS